MNRLREVALVAAATACVTTFASVLSCSSPRSPITAPPSEPVVVSRAEALKRAYAAKDYIAFLRLSRADAEATPDSPRALYNLACAYALNERATATADVLDVLVGAKIFFDISKDDDFAAVAKTPELIAVRARFEALKAPLVASSVAFTLRDRDLLTEGIAHDNETGAFFVSAVHGRKIVRVDRNGAVTDFVSAAKDGMLGVLGIAVDVKRRALFATTAGVPEMEGATPETLGQGAILELDVDTGAVRRQVALTGGGRKHTPGDLALNARGDAFVTDATSGAVYTLPVGTKVLSQVVPPGTFASPQGIVAFANGSLLVADYSRGLYRVDRVDEPGGLARAVVKLTLPDGVLLTGIDGLAARSVGNATEIIASQNGVDPPRIVRLTLDPRANGVESATILEMNNPLFAEPTLGTVVGDDYFFVARSQWASFDPKATPTKPRDEPIVLKIPLRDPRE